MESLRPRACRTDMKNFCALKFGRRGPPRFLRLHLAPIPIVGRQRDEDLAFGMSCNVGETQNAFALLRPALAERQKPAETAISRAVLRIDEQARRVLKIEAGADHHPQPPNLLGILRSNVGAHDAGKRVAIRDCNGRKPEHLCLRDKLLGMRGAAQK